MPDVRRHLFDPASPFYYPVRWFIILSLGLIIYGQTFGFGFVFDDHIFIVTNQAIKDPGKFWDMWSAFPLTRLVGMASFAFNYALHQLHPAGYHVFNVIVHVAAALAVWGTAGILFRIRPSTGIPAQFRRELPFIIALLFLVHPCQTQAVTYISQRFESLATLFYLTAVYSYAQARTSPASRQRILFGAMTVFSVILGIFSKETAFTLPLMLFLVEWMIIRSENVVRLFRWPRAALLMAGFLLFAVLWIKLGSSKVDILFSPVVSESHDGDVLTAGQYMLTQMRVFLTFLRLLVFPVNQNLEYDYPMSMGLFDPPLTLIGTCVIAGIMMMIAKFLRHFPLIAFGLSWMLVTFSMNLVPRPNFIFEHKLYLISFGFLLAAVTGMAALVRNPKVLLGVFLTVIVIWTAASVHRNRIWSSEQVLWEDTLKKSPGKARVCANVSRIYSELGRNEEALHLMDKAVAIRPNEYVYHLNRGILFSRLGKTQEALGDFNKAIEISPRQETYTARAELYLARNNEDAALADLAEAVRVHPNYPDAYAIRGSLWMRKGRYDEALADFSRALAVAPHTCGVLINRGAVYFTTGNYEKALADFTNAQRIEPTELTHKNRAYCFLALNRIQEARQEFEAVLALNPSDPQTRLQYEKIKP